MNTTLLHYAVTYAACGSAQKTAERLAVSRSSVTRNIKKLEEELGTKLFINTADGIVPTYLGDICLRYAREILRDEENLKFDLSDNGTYRGVIDIGMGTNRAQQILPMVLPKFQQRYPQITIQLHELSTTELASGLLNCSLDFAVVSELNAGDGIEFTPLMVDHLVLVAPQNDSFVDSCSYKRDGKLYVTVDQFKDKQFILGYASQKSREICNRLFKTAGFEPHIAFQTHNNGTAVKLAYNGFAYALVPESCTWAEKIQIKHYCFEPQLGASWKIGIATLANNNLSRSAEQLKNMIIEMLDQADEGDHFI